MSVPSIACGERNVLITGASSGFGRLLVEPLLEQGWRVFASMRQAASRQSAVFGSFFARYPGRLIVLDLDITRAQDRSHVMAELQRQAPAGLHCLINNAGVGVFGALEETSEAQLRQVFETNFFGLTLLTRELLPELRKAAITARGVKIINVSSALGFLGMPLTSIYSASKFALEGLSESLSHELKPFGVQVCLMEPGGFATRFDGNSSWGESSFTPDSVYFSQTRAYQALRERRLRNGGVGDPTDFARVVVKAALSPRVPLRMRCGRDAKLGWRVRRGLPERWGDALFSFLFQRLLPSKTLAQSQAGRVISKG